MPLFTTSSTETTALEAILLPGVSALFVPLAMGPTMVVVVVEDATIKAESLDLLPARMAFLFPFDLSTGKS